MVCTLISSGDTKADAHSLLEKQIANKKQNDSKIPTNNKGTKSKNKTRSLRQTMTGLSGKN